MCYSATLIGRKICGGGLRLTKNQLTMALREKGGLNFFNASIQRINKYGDLLTSIKAEACNFTKSNTRPWVFFMFLKLCK